MQNYPAEEANFLWASTLIIIESAILLFFSYIQYIK